MNINKVAVYTDNKWNGELSKFYPFRADVIRKTRMMMAPIETGTNSIDNKVLDPIVIKIVGKVGRIGEASGLLYDTDETYRYISSMVDNKKSPLYSVATTDGFYNNLSMSGARLIGEAKELDQTEVELEFTEILLVQGESSKKRDKGNNSRSRSGYIAG